MLGLLPDDAYQVIMVTLSLTPRIPALTAFNRISPNILYVPVPDDILMPSPKPVVPVTPLTYTSPTAV